MNTCGAPGQRSMGQHRFRRVFGSWREVWLARWKCESASVHAQRRSAVSTSDFTGRIVDLYVPVGHGRLAHPALLQARERDSLAVTEPPEPDRSSEDTGAPRSCAFPTPSSQLPGQDLARSDRRCRRNSTSSMYHDFDSKDAISPVDAPLPHRPRCSRTPVRHRRHALGDRPASDVIIDLCVQSPLRRRRPGSVAVVVLRDTQFEQ